MRADERGARVSFRRRADPALDAPADTTRTTLDHALRHRPVGDSAFRSAFARCPWSRFFYHGMRSPRELEAFVHAQPACRAIRPGGFRPDGGHFWRLSSGLRGTRL